MINYVCVVDTVFFFDGGFSKTSFMLRRTFLRIHKKEVQRLGRWDPRRSDAVKMKVGHMADHDGCGALTCATPSLQAIAHSTHDADKDGAEWLMRHHYSVSATPPPLTTSGTKKDDDE